MVTYTILHLSIKKGVGHCSLVWYLYQVAEAIMMQQCNERLQHNQCCRPDPMHKFTRIQHLKMPVETKWKPGPRGSSNTSNKIQNVTTFASLSDARHPEQVHSKKHRKTTNRSALNVCWQNKSWFHWKMTVSDRNEMQPTNPNAHTYMLMVQMSKHMDMQSRRTLFCNSLLEQSSTYFPCYQSAVWSGKCSVGCGV